jgi:hypothetical protein
MTRVLEYYQGVASEEVKAQERLRNQEIQAAYRKTRSYNKARGQAWTRRVEWGREGP